MSKQTVILLATETDLTNMVTVANALRKEDAFVTRSDVLRHSLATAAAAIIAQGKGSK